MSYVIQNKNSYYVKLSETRAVKKTLDINEATLFKTVDDANKVKSQASRKLKDYIVISEENAQKQVEDRKKKIKRRQFTSEERATVYNNAHGICEICGKFVPMNSFTVDHIIPISKGGTYEFSNLQLAHESCNLMKTDALPEDFFDKMIEILNYQGKKSKKMKKKMKKKLKK